MELRRDLRVPHQGNLITREYLTRNGDLLEMEIGETCIKKPREIMEHQKFPKDSRDPHHLLVMWASHHATAPREGRGTSLEASSQT